MKRIMRKLLPVAASLALTQSGATAALVGFWEFDSQPDGDKPAVEMPPAYPLRTLKRISHKVAISIFTLLEVLGLPRDGKKQEGRGA